MSDDQLEQILKDTRLRDRMKEAMRLVIGRGLTQAEAAKACGVSRQAVNYAYLSIAMKLRQANG